MMKFKFVALAVCSLLCVGATYSAVNLANNDVQYVSALETAVDISAGATISGWEDKAEMKQLTISFAENALSDFNYDAMDKDNFLYVQEYLLFNGKTVKEINQDESLGAKTWTYTQFPGNADDKYKVPVLIYERDSARLRLFIHENYFAMLGDSIVFEIKEGLTFINEGTSYVMEESRSFAYSNGNWVAAKEEVEITEDVTITGWDITGGAGELTYTRINLGEGVMPEGVGYGIIDNTNYTYLQDYITINGVTVADINANTDDSNYVYSTFPSSADAKYAIPVIIYVNEGTLEVKVHNDYVATLGDTVTIGVKSGAYVENGSKKYIVKQDVTKDVLFVANTYTVTFMDGDTVVDVVSYTEGQESIEEPAVPVKAGYSSAWESYTLSGGDIIVNAVHTLIPVTDITEDVTIIGWDITGDADELTYTRINLGEGVMPEGVGYGIIDNANYTYLQDYITINGVTVADINANTDDSNYVYSTFPSSADAKYAIPVIIYVNEGTLEVKVHNDYVTTFGEDPTVVIGVKAGASVAGDNAIYKVNEDVSVAVREKTIIEDITEDVTITGWDITGDEEELTYTRINLGEGVMPEGLGYGIIDNENYTYLQEYITINGVTVADINANTDDSNYVYSTFPSSVNAKYAIPVIIYVNEGKLEVKFHNDYLATLGENIDVKIAVKAGLSIVDGSTVYTVVEDVEQYVKRKVFTLTVEMGSTVVEHTLSVGSEIALGEPEKEHYTFVGWFEKDTDNAILTAMPESNYAVYAKYEAIEYTVTFMDGEEVLDTVTYTVENTEITEPAVPTKEGYTSAWESYELTGGDITVDVVYTLIDDNTGDDITSDDSASDDSSSDDITSDDSSSDDITSGDSTSDDITADDSSSNATSDSGASSDVTTSFAGCFGTVSGLSVGLVGLLAAILLKKKENE